MKGSTKIMTIAQSTTTVMAIGAYSFFAPTAPATAIEAETPQTAPPAPSVAASCRSSPSRRAAKKMTRKVVIETIEAWMIAMGPAQRIKVKGSVDRFDHDL